MKLICLVKFVPDPDSPNYDADSNQGACENARMILNPDDACALSFALKMKACNTDYFIEVVSLGSLSVRPHMEDLIRLNINRGTLIADSVFDGSDSSVTSEVLARYIQPRPFDCLLTGSLSLDTGASCAPVQVAQILGLNQMLGITQIDAGQFDHTRAVFDVADDNTITTYEMKMPGVLSLTRESGYTLPYIKLKDMQRDVSDELVIITNDTLGFSDAEIRQAGSLTKVMKPFSNSREKKERVIVKNNDEGIDHVFMFLKEKGFI